MAGGGNSAGGWRRELGGWLAAGRSPPSGARGEIGERENSGAREREDQ